MISSLNLEDLPGALHDFLTIKFGNIGAHVWHICMRNNPQLTERTIFADMTLLPICLIFLPGMTTKPVPCASRPPILQTR